MQSALSASGSTAGRPRNTSPPRSPAPGLASAAAAELSMHRIARDFGEHREAFGVIRASKKGKAVPRRRSFRSNHGSQRLTLKARAPQIGARRSPR